MKFPIIINDQQELDRLIYKIATVTAKTTAREVLMIEGKIKPYITKADCYRFSSRRKIDHALKTGTLQYVIKGKRQLIKREHFEEFLNNDTF